MSGAQKKPIMIGDLPMVDLMERGFLAIKGKTHQLTRFFGEMNKAPTGIPTNKKAAEIFQMASNVVREAAATVTFVASRYAMGDVTTEQIENALSELGFSAEESRSFVSGVRSLSDKTLRLLRTSALVLAAPRVSPRWESFRSSIDFKPVSGKDGLKAIVPFVSLNMTFRAAGRGKESKELAFEMSIMEFLSLTRTLASVYERLKRETLRLSEKMGDVVINPKTVEMMYPVTDDV